MPGVVVSAAPADRAGCAEQGSAALCRQPDPAARMAARALVGGLAPDTQRITRVAVPVALRVQGRTSITPPDYRLPRWPNGRSPAPAKLHPSKAFRTSRPPRRYTLEAGKDDDRISRRIFRLS